MTTEEVKFKISFVYLVPILASLIFGLGCTWLLKPQHEQAPIPPSAVMPFPDDTISGPIGNALLYVVLAAIGATVFLILIKRRKVKLVKSVIFLVMTTVSMMLSLLYISELLSYTSFYSDFLLVGLSILITVLFDLAIFKYTKAQSVAVIGLGGALGAVMAFAFPPYSVIAVLIALAIYDIIAVYRGPVGKIAQAGLDQLPGLSYSFKDIQMGLGDLIFYTVLTGSMFFSFPNSILPTIMSIIGICIGSIITFLMLEKKRIFPGLPFPIALGLALGLLTALFI
ncbi:MAG: presenilin family intramembrane aspartyl protease [Candidatus Bathyarchaeota archaeon]|nr:presenilin family intramembrane aspartyl protease [Candidatus Termiticorpusculum sp.]